MCWPSRNLLVNNGVHHGVGGAGVADAVVEERGDVATVAAFGELDVVDGVATQLLKSAAGVLQGFDGGAELGTQLVFGVSLIRSMASSSANSATVCSSSVSVHVG